MVLENPGKCWNWEKKIPGPIPGQNSRPWKVLLKIWVVVLKSPGGRYFLFKDYWGCATGWGRIFTTGLTIMG